MSGASPATSLPPSIPAGAAKRTSARQDCSRVHPNVSHDPHTVCITCRGLCSDAIRCEECAGWDALTVGRTSSYQAKSAQRRSRYARSRRHGRASAPRSPIVVGPGKGTLLGGGTCGLAVFYGFRHPSGLCFPRGPHTLPGGLACLPIDPWFSLSSYAFRYDFFSAKCMSE